MVGACRSSATSAQHRAVHSRWVSLGKSSGVPGDKNSQIETSLEFGQDLAIV